MNNPIQGYAIFHLNLAFSSIEQHAHIDVINNCYWPLLTLIEKDNIPLGIELTAYTLEAIELVAPNWVAKFKELLSKGLCELIASGDSQIIGPIIPAEVNQHNLRLGQQSYLDTLGIEPTLAYINEQAVSSGLLDVYIDAGFDAVVMEWDNPYSHNSDWSRDRLNRAQTLRSASGRCIKVIWNHAIAFQKFQRYAHGEIPLQDYLHFLKTAIPHQCKSFPVYGSDAEIFNYRPGRYSTEAQYIDGEWLRISNFFKQLKHEKFIDIVTPSSTLTYSNDTVPLTIATAAHPISVKKQAKYNVTRWALSGRDDLHLNSLCYESFYALKRSNNVTDSDWQQLCRDWASDLRTHLTQARFEKLNLAKKIKASSEKTELKPIKELKPFQISHDSERQKLHIKSPYLHLTLNTNRGMSIEALSFISQAFKPVCGTLPHGHFDHISYGADFYSNHLVMERYKERDRVTDLGKSNWQLENNNGKLQVSIELNTPNGPLAKWYIIDKESVKCGFSFKRDGRPESSLRLGFITLLNCDSPCWFACHNGGYHQEVFNVATDSEIDHGTPVSSIVSSNSALGATTGEILFGNQEFGINLSWDPSQCAALPMISSKKIDSFHLNRLWFSLVEADETLKNGGYLPQFEYMIQPTMQPKQGEWL